MNKFAVAIAMQCTLEQFEKDLKPTLAELGYNIHSVTKYLDSRNVLTINDFDNLDSVLWLRKQSFSRMDKQNIIRLDSYNPKLFLALAAIRTDNNAYKDNYFMCTKSVIMLDSLIVAYTQGKMYKSEKYNCITDNQGDIEHEIDGPFLVEHFRKLIPEEIIEMYIPKPIVKLEDSPYWYIQITEENCEVLENWRNKQPNADTDFLLKGYIGYWLLNWEYDYSYIWEGLKAEMSVPNGKKAKEITIEEFLSITSDGLPAVDTTYKITCKEDYDSLMQYFEFHKIKWNKGQKASNWQPHYGYKYNYCITYHHVYGVITCCENYSDIESEFILSDIPNINKQKTIKEMGTKTFKTTRANMKAIYAVACSTWQTKITEMTTKYGNAFSNDVVLPESEVKAMFEAANGGQIRVLTKVFPEYRKDNNAFVTSFEDDSISDVSRKLFGNSSTLQIAIGAAIKADRSDLRGRALYFSTAVKLVMHTLSDGGTVLEIQER